MSAEKLHKQGVNLFRKGKPEAALEKFQEALTSAADNQRKTAEIYNDIGVAYKELENFEAAHNSLDEAMTKFTELTDQKGQGLTLGNRAAVFEAQGEMEKAVETYKESAKMLEEAGENEMALYSWQAVSRIRTKQGQYIAAIGAYEEGVDNMPEGSLKRKVLKQILKMPGGLLGGGAAPLPPATDEDDDK